MKHVALLIETSRSYGRELLRGVKRFLNESGGWSVFVEIRDLEAAPPPWLKTWQGDGILVRSGNTAMSQAVARTGLPAVELRTTSLKSGLPYIGVDNDAIGRMVAQHFIERGFRHFGVYELDTETFFVERRDSFKRVVEQHGWKCDSFLQPLHAEKPRDWERQQQQLLKWIKQLPKPCSIMACTDQLGCWLLDACRRDEVKIPEEIAVVGVENDESLCEMSSPPLSSVCLGGERIGYEAAKLLDGLMRGVPSPPHPSFFPPQGMITRLSSDTLAVEDRWLSAALSIVRQRACDGLRVDDILNEIPISRSKLERGFRDLLGRSPNAEINRVRLTRIQALLRDTDLSLDQIARKTAFASSHYLIELFRQSFGITPGEYRRGIDPSPQ